jgi:hypothetical protein
MLNIKFKKIHRSRIHGLMSQSFSSKSFSSEINKTRRKTEEINNTSFNCTDYEKQFGSQDNHSSGQQRLNCNLCPGKSFKDNTRLKIHVDKYHTNSNLPTSSNFSSTVSITKLLINLKQQLPTIRRLPKACRHLAADKLSSIINNCLSTKSISSFADLLLFSYRAFNVAEKSDKSLNKHIKENLSNFEVPQIRTSSKRRTHLSLAKKVEAKVADFDIKGAVKLLSSDDSLASFNEDVAEELKKKHPSPSRELFFPDAFKTGDFSLIVNEQNVREAINSIGMLCYRNPSTLFFGDHLISSSVGAQQGDPCGPMIFSLAIQPIILSLNSELNIWYLDDGTLADYPEVVLSDFKKVINLSRKIGLELNFNKCEIFSCSGDTDLKVIKEFQNLAPGIKICDRGSLSLLGSPIFDQGFKNTVEKTIITVENLLNKAEFLSRHVAYTLIKNCLFIPKFNFLLRTTPFWKFSNYVNSIDSSLKSSLEKILNLRLTDLQWCQSTLPIRFGGLGIRRISDICLPAFLSSVHGVKKLVSQLLNSKDNELIIHHYDEALAAWGVANENEIPTIPQFQKNWDNINIKRIIDNDLIFNSSRDLARFKALQCRESGSWLHAIPSPNIGTLLDNTSFQVCIGLRLGCNLCTPANAMRKLMKLVFTV